MKILFLCNFGPGVVSGKEIFGGSENVLYNISKFLVQNYNYEVDISAFNYKEKQIYNNIKLFSCSKIYPKEFIDILNSYGHIFIYSDSYWGLSDVLRNIKQIKPKISLALVGAYFLSTHPEYLKIIKDNTDKFNLIVHSSLTVDYKFCIDNNLPVEVIPNGIDISEFDNKINFREKYAIKEKYILLNISNLFFGKNQSALGLINKELKKYIKDFIFVQISSSIKYPYEQTFLNKAKKSFGNDRCLFLRDIPREDVISAYKNSDIFINVSGKEVAPIVLRESMGNLPFITMNVGDVEDFPAVIINGVVEDNKGYKIIDKKVIDSYVKEIINLLTNKNLRDELIKRGQEKIKDLDWKNIVPKYKEIFER